MSRAARTLPRPALRLPALLLAVLAAAFALLPGSDAADAQTAAPAVTGLEVSSTPASGVTYLLGETIRVTVTFSAAVDVSGAPRLKIDMDPAEWGEKWARYEGGTGTASLTFAHTVVEPNYSTQGIAVLANTLELNGGAIRSASSGNDAALAHAGRDHDADHKVDWQRTAPNRPRSDVGIDAVAGGPAISSATATLTSVTVAWSAPSSDGGAAITAYDLRYIESDASDKSDGQWTDQHDIWETGGGALSYTQTGLTPSTGYDFQVRAVNADGDGAWSATQTATTGTPAITGSAALSYAENSATRVGTFSVAGADEDDEVTWAISGTDASHFDISTPKGALRLIDTADTATGLKRPKQPDFESPDDDGADNSYSITLTATVGGVDATLAVTVTVTDVDEPGAIALAPARPRVGTALTATLSDPDTVSGTTIWAWQRSSGRNNWSTITGATAASYTPVAGDSGQYLRVIATYTDGHGANKSAEATANHVVIASVLTGLTATATRDSSLGLTPDFEDDVLHYKVSCGNGDTMTVTPTAADGVRLAVNGTQTVSGTAVEVTLGWDDDVVIRASNAAGGYTDYVVHCVRDWLATMEAIDRGMGDVTELLVSLSFRDFLAVIDHHGVPRFRRHTPSSTAMFFRNARVGSSGEYQWSYSTRQGRCAVHHILDEDFVWLKAVSSRSPLQCTGVHDFRILENGGYLLMSYEPSVNRDLSHITLHESLVADDPHGSEGRVWGRIVQSWRTTQFTAAEALSDSAFQILTPSLGVSRTWRSWGAMAYEDCVQHWWDEWAHVNLVQYYEGSVIASFRGCSKVLSISASTGKVEWRLGRSNLSDEEWEARNIGPAPLKIVGDPEGEFCSQHAAELHPGNRLTLFDNGEGCLLNLATGETRRTSNEYARALEYAVDVDNGEAVFLRDHSQHGTRNIAGTRGGHVDVLDNGDWLIAWARERPQEQHAMGKLSPDEAITQVDPSTGTEKLSFRIPAGPGSEFQANTRPTAVPAYVLAPQPVALSAHAPASERTSPFHKGDDDTPQVVVAFNQPVVDFTATSPSLSVSGGTITAVSALVADGEAANAYLVTLDPAGAGTVTLRLLANKTCASGGICTADGTTLTGTPPAIGVTPGPLVSFERATYSVTEGASGAVVVRLSKAHQSPVGVTIPIVLNAVDTTASTDDLSPDFGASPGQSVTFQRGETRKTISVQPATDTLVEGDETVALGFGTLPDAVGTGSTTTTTVTIKDATRPTITFSRLDGELAEGANAAFTFEVTNGVTFAADATINLALSGSATAGDDFTLEAGGSTLSAPYTVTFPAGESSTSFTIRATDDSDAEPADETVTIRASLALGDTSLFFFRTVIIQPSDVANVPDVTIEADGDVTEGESASFTLQRTGATTAALTVSVKVTTSGAALSGGAPSIASFGVGSATATLSLPTRDDTVVRDAGGQVTVYLLGSPSNPPAYLTTPQNQATVTVIEDDVASFTVTASAEEVTEGQSVTLTVDTGGVTFPDAQTIELQLGGSATPGDDYTLPGGCTASPCLLTLPRGARTVRATFRTRYDGVEEGSESIDIDVYHGEAYLDFVSIDLVDGIAPAPSPFVPGGGGGGGAGGGGGGGGSSGPSPSEAEFEWNVKRDLEALDAEHDLPTGAWSDGTTLWLANNASGRGDAVYAYDLASGERIAEREFELDERNRAPRGIWADAQGVAWVSDSGRNKLFAYDLATGERLEDRDIELDRRNAAARGIWSDSEAMWVLDGNRDALFAYDLESGAPLGEYALDARNRDPRGLWSDGVTAWVSDHGAKQLFAYRLPALPDEPPEDLPALERVVDEEFEEPGRVGNNSPRGLWSDGDVMYVADANDGRVYTYNMPAAIDARLASLVLAGVEFGEFSPARTEYEGGAETGVEEATVEAAPAQAEATLAIAPPDADDDPGNGYQVTLAGTGEITVTVTSPDGSRTRVYRVALASREVPDAPQGRLDECLRGPVAPGGFSLMLAGGGSVDDLAACASRRGVAALHALHEGEWLSYNLGAPEFVNDPFRELFAAGLPPGTPLVVRGGEPPAAEADSRLASLALDGVAFGAFSPGRTEYAGVADEGLTQAAVGAVPAQAGASVVITPADADGDPANGHQVALQAGAPVTVTVTSSDGTRTAVYRLWIAGAGVEAAPDGEAAPECLRGEIGPGFSLVAYEGGDVGALDACARSLGIAALYALADGVYVPYFPGAPDFVNEAFRELFPHGLPPDTPLVASGSGT